MHDKSETINIGDEKFGVVADLHGNSIALDAILDHARTEGVERWLVLGDVVAMGPDPVGVLERLDQLDVIAFIAGNTERYVLTGDRPSPSFDDVIANPSRLPQLIEVATSFAWTRGALHASGWLEHLRSYEASARLEMNDVAAIAIHASEAADDGIGITPSLTGEHAATLFSGTADVVFGGHTHQATDISRGSTRFINPGSVSNHPSPGAGACYATVAVHQRPATSANERVTELAVEHHNIAYDKGAAVDAIIAAGIPGAGFLLRTYFNVPHV